MSTDLALSPDQQDAVLNLWRHRQSVDRYLGQIVNYGYEEVSPYQWRRHQRLASTSTLIHVHLDTARHWREAVEARHEAYLKREEARAPILFA